MGRLFLVNFEGKSYSCKHCKTNLALWDDVVSKMLTKGDSHRMMRTLQAVYHPRNQYILHLDLEAPPKERLELAMSVKSDPTFREVENVRVMSQSNLVTYKGPTMIACTLQGVAILLKESLDWDWFLNLSAFGLSSRDTR